MKGQIFLSYSFKDKDFAEQLTEQLALRGFSVWSDSLIQPGENWENAITSALSAADVFVPILSPDFTRSDFNIAEVGAAYGYDKPILPILRRGKLSTMPFQFSSFQLLDARKTDLPTLAKNIEHQLLQVVA